MGVSGVGLICAVGCWALLFASFPLVGLLSTFWLVVIVVFGCVLVLLIGVFAVEGLYVLVGVHFCLLLVCVCVVIGRLPLLIVLFMQCIELILILFIVVVTVVCCCYIVYCCFWLDFWIGIWVSVVLVCW